MLMMPCSTVTCQTSRSSPAEKWVLGTSPRMTSVGATNTSIYRNNGGTRLDIPETVIDVFNHRLASPDCLAYFEETLSTVTLTRKTHASAGCGTSTSATTTGVAASLTTSFTISLPATPSSARSACAHQTRMPAASTKASASHRSTPRPPPTSLSPNKKGQPLSQPAPAQSQRQLARACSNPTQPRLASQRLSQSAPP